jgi:hypothetical protein
MTITLTPDEIRTYRDAVQHWAIARSAFLADVRVSERSIHMSESLHKSDLKTKVEQWDLNNPMPTLLPKL